MRLEPEDITEVSVPSSADRIAAASTAILSSKPPTICILALSAIADDPRVRRQAEAFHRAGWSVVAVGLPGAKSTEPEWAILTDAPQAAGTTGVPSKESRSPQRQWLLRQFQRATKVLFANEVRRQSLETRIKRRVVLVLQLLHGLQQRLLRTVQQLAVRVRPEMAQLIYWSSSQSILDIYDRAQRVDAAVWLANDWTVLPMAGRLACERGGVYGYDTHEFAIEEYGESLKWRLLQRPIVSALERQFIDDAVVVSAVSPGIAEHLDKLYRLPRATLTVRNTPAYEETPFCPTQPDRIQILYHGIVTPNRGIEVAIDSVALWRPEFTLTIRGPENPAFSPALRERIAGLGLGHRVRLVPPVPMTALVGEAALFDVGLFALPGHSRHNEFALPNKFFEYVMAGLALCTTDLPEMAALIREYDLGVTIAMVEPKAIAAAINALDPDRIDRFKRNALAAARELCWERESQRLVAAYATALAQVTRKLQ
jgi:glycosyltransferase involved in cell wall biosynthesis